MKIGGFLVITTIMVMSTATADEAGDANRAANSCLPVAVIGKVHRWEPDAKSVQIDTFTGTAGEAFCLTVEQSWGESSIALGITIGARERDAAEWLRLQ